MTSDWDDAFIEAPLLNLPEFRDLTAQGFSALTAAAYMGEDEMLDAFLLSDWRHDEPDLELKDLLAPPSTQTKAGGDGLLDAVDIMGRTPLLAACEGGRLSTVRKLIRWGADPSYVTQARGTTAAMKAAEGGHVIMLQELMDALRSKGKPTGLERADAASQETALHKACRHGHTECVAMLMNAKKGLVLLRDAEEHTPLDVAILQGHADTAFEIIARCKAKRKDNAVYMELLSDALFTALCSKQHTVSKLDEAAYVARNKILTDLLNTKVITTSTAVEKYGGMSAFVVAAMMGEDGLMLAFRHAFHPKLSIDAITYQMDLAFFFARARGHATTVDAIAMLCGGKEPTPDAASLLHQAVKKGHWEVFRHLLDHVDGAGFDYNQPVSGETLAFRAASRKGPEGAIMLEELLWRGRAQAQQQGSFEDWELSEEGVPPAPVLRAVPADPMRPVASGHTPMCAVCAMGTKESLEVLVAYGADITVTCKNQTMLQIARKRQNVECERLLQPFFVESPRLSKRRCTTPQRTPERGVLIKSQ